MSKLNNKVAIITGATSEGIGRETALRLSSKGVSLIVTGRNEDAGNQTAEMVINEGGKCKYIPHDISNEENWLHIIDQTINVYGSLDFLINNAGQFWIKSIADTSLEDFNEICSVNIDGTWLGMKHCLERMNNGGAIVNVSSLMGQMGLPDGTGYCASKGAVTSMTKAVALEAAEKNIRVNALHPGVIWTPMVGGGEQGDENLKNFFIQETPIRMVGLPEHMADAILFLCSAEYITGIDLNVDGGRLADGSMGSHAG